LFIEKTDEKTVMRIGLGYVRGTVQNQDGIVHLKAEHVEALTVGESRSRRMISIRLNSWNSKKQQLLI
jgi:hypothetical protein